jgi:hypothetical protein
MQFGAITFNGDAGRHTDKNDVECTGRAFRVTSRGVGGVYANYVQCRICGLELQAYENGLAQPHRTTFADAIRHSARTRGVPCPA